MSSVCKSLLRAFRSLFANTDSLRRDDSALTFRGQPPVWQWKWTEQSGQGVDMLVEVVSSQTAKRQVLHVVRAGASSGLLPGKSKAALHLVGSKRP